MANGREPRTCRVKWGFVVVSTPESGWHTVNGKYGPFSIWLEADVPTIVRESIARQLHSRGAATIHDDVQRASYPTRLARYASTPRTQRRAA